MENFKATNNDKHAAEQDDLPLKQINNFIKVSLIGKNHIVSGF